ncbi:ribosome biogenesis GTPase YqeH [Hutsoniella sourekii]|uniref:ribosome biogenesis GTPase YqeH n=1 Tax=Hutsoniella sourekii TaxID=87650 RepID=UPI00048449E8|nr:ribosome biogenesis GTPase YqeH [Hutsoniella sourekii]
MTRAHYQCIGCGTQIQTEDPKQAGYLPASALAKGLEKGEFYCQRCFRLRNYNELQDLDLDEDVFLDRLSQIAYDEAFIINVIDIFDVEGSVISGLHRFIGSQPFIVVANKVDLLPKAVKLSRVKHWLQHELAQYGLKPQEIILASAKKPGSLEALTQIIEKQIQSRNVYIVGVTNVGKSTLINQLIQHYGGDREIITTSNHPGTTLDLIEIPLTEDHAIIDTPGIIRSSQLAHYLNREDLQAVLPKKTFKPKTFQLNPGQTIFVGGLARIDFTQGDRSALTFYMANDLYMHRTKTERADEVYQKHAGDLLSPPSQAVPSDQWVKQSIRLNGQEDVAISGLGWLTSNQAVDLDVWTYQGVSVSKRASII